MKLLRSRPKITVVRDGKALKPWQIRAGLLIVKTTYSHDRREVVITVAPRDIEETE